MTRGVLLVLIACACSSPRHTSVARNERREAHGPLRSPHTGIIILVAATDRGDAAFTYDTVREFRLWPSLDGKLEPVVVAGQPAEQLALGRDVRGGLVAAILDEAGGVEVVRFDATGVSLGRTIIATDVDEIVVVAGNVVVRNRDQTLAMFTSDGKSRGHLTPESGMRMLSLATRRDALVVGATDAGDSANEAWFVTLDPFSWGPRHRLPLALDEIALSPSHERIAGFATDSGPRIIELGPRGAKVVGEVKPDVATLVEKKKRRPRALPQPVIGFVSEEHLVTSRPHLQWLPVAGNGWVAKDIHDPVEAHAAVVDVAIAGHGASLVIVSEKKTQYLGYQKVGHREDVVGALPLVRNGASWHWLDRDLREKRVTHESDLPHGLVKSNAEFALDDRHLLVTTVDPSEPDSKQRISIYDAQTKAITSIGELDRAHAYHSVDSPSGIVGFHDENVLVRYRFRGARATKLRPIAVSRASLHPIYLVDPAKSGGVVAIVVPFSDRATVDVFSLGSQPDVDGRPLVFNSMPIAILNAGVIAVDRLGNVYMNTGADVAVYRASAPDAPPRRIPIKDAQPGIVSHDGRALALRAANGFVIYDSDGVQRWRTSMEDLISLSFTPDDRQLLAVSTTGIAAFDAATGERTAAVCGWAFGLYDIPFETLLPNVPSTCTDGR